MAEKTQIGEARPEWSTPAPVAEFDSLKSLDAAPSYRRSLAILVIVLLVGVIAGLILVPWVQTVSGTGRVVAFAPMERQQTVDATVEGRIVRWYVVEGSRVKAGDRIADMSDNDPNIMLHLGQERLAVVTRLEAASQRAASLRERINGLDGSRRNAMEAAASRVEMAQDRLRAADQAVAAALAAQRAATLNIDRQRRLADKGLASARAVELAELDQTRALTEADRARASLDAARNEILALRADRQKVETDFRGSIDDARASEAAARAEAANAAAELQRLQVRLGRQEAQVVTAPRDGTVFRLLAQPGGNVIKSGEPIAILIPDNSQPVVELWLRGNDIPLVKEGDKVRLQFEGWPALQFSGWPSVATGTFGGKVALVDAADDGKGKFRILVSQDTADQPWPSRRYMRQGVRANGWVLLNSVPLWFELWRQFNGFPPAIAQSEPKPGKE